MKQKSTLRARLSQRLKLSPTLRYSVAGAALASFFCLIMFIYINLGNNKQAIANKTTKPEANSSNSGTTTPSNINDNKNGENPSSTITFPSNIKIKNLTYSDATIKWTTVDGADNYMLRMRPLGSNDWTYIALKNKQKKLNNLAENTTYEFQIQSFSKVDSSGWSPLQTFKTLLSCSSPVNLTTTNVNSSTVMAHWTADPNAKQYAIQYKEEGQTEWSDEFQLDGHANRFLLTSLKPGTNYQWQIRSQCSESENSWSDYQPMTFATSIREEETNSGSTVNHNVKISPNPTSGQFSIALGLAQNTATTAHLEISNLAGQLLMKENIPVENNMVYEALSLGNSIPQGFYLVKITAGNQVYETQISIAR